MSETFEQLETNSLLKRGLAVTGLAAAVSAVAVLKFVNPSSSGWFPVCLFHQVTGMNCPGCGATRGLHALLNGDVLLALHYNLMLIVIVPLMLYGAAALFLIAVRGRGLPFPKDFLLLQLAGGFLAMMLIFGVLRNLPFYPFTLLAP